MYPQLIAYIEVKWISWLLALLMLGSACLAWPIAQRYESKLAKFLSAHEARGLSHVIKYFWFIFFLMFALHQLGVELGTLLGAAGVFTLAVSFAAQNTVSCIISGLFLWFEAPFKLGDMVKIGLHHGQVLNIGLMATQLKRSDGVLVRISNASVYKSDLLNYSHFNQQRMSVSVTTHREGYRYLKDKFLELSDSISGIKAPTESAVVLKEIVKDHVVILCYFWAPCVAQGSEESLNHIFAQLEQELHHVMLQSGHPIYGLRLLID